VARARLAAFEERRGRFHILKKTKVDVPRILRMGGVAALTCGQETMGVASTALLNQRQATASMLVIKGMGI